MLARRAFDQGVVGRVQHELSHRLGERHVAASGDHGNRLGIGHLVRRNPDDGSSIELHLPAAAQHDDDAFSLKAVARDRHRAIAGKKDQLGRGGRSESQTSQRDQRDGDCPRL